MALQKINWSQIDTEFIPSGSELIFGSINDPINSLYVDQLFINNGQNIQDYVSSSISDSQIFNLSGSLYRSDNEFEINGPLTINGPLVVNGQTIFDSESTDPSLVVKGAIEIIKNQFLSGSITIENLGIIADRDVDGVLDCGDGFF